MGRRRTIPRRRSGRPVYGLRAKARDRGRMVRCHASCEERPFISTSRCGGGLGLPDWTCCYFVSSP